MRCALLTTLVCCLLPAAVAVEKGRSAIVVCMTDECVEVETDALQARIRKKGYVSVAAGGQGEPVSEGEAADPAGARELPGRACAGAHPGGQAEGRPRVPGRPGPPARVAQRLGQGSGHTAPGGSVASAVEKRFGAFGASLLSGRGRTCCTGSPPTWTDRHDRQGPHRANHCTMPPVQVLDCPLSPLVPNPPSWDRTHG